jgi:hypothetical protein
VSWGDFLGTNRIADQNRIYLSYTEAKKYLKKYFPEIKNSIDYKKCNLTEFLHKKPNIKYKNEWKGWGEYLSNPNAVRRNVVSYDEFIVWINKNFPNKKSKEEFKKLVKENKIPHFIPKKPEGVYKSAGWSGWKKF